MDEDSEMAESDSNLVYPKIQSIFSTINIKTEVSDYEDNQLEEVELSDYENNEYYMPIPNKIILGSKPPSQPSGELNLQTEFSKASTSEINLSFRCDECNIFFATQDDLDSHESAIHSFLVARPMSNSRKSPAKSVASLHSFTEDSSQDTIIQKKTNSKLNNSFPILKKAVNKRDVKKPNTDEIEKKTDGLLCSHCNVHFPNEIELIKHTYELIPENVTSYVCETCDENFNTPAELNVHRITHKQKMIEQNQKKLLRCFICSLYLIQPGSLKNHLLSNHNSNDISLKPVSFKGKCALCSRTFPNYRLFNKHIPYVHPKIYTSKKLIKPKEPRDIVNVKKSVVRTNVYSKVRNSVKSKKQNLNLLKALLSRDMPVPNRVLFKCNKCPIHFVTCSQALEHSVQCNINRKSATWNCNKCRRTFATSERYLHTMQHNVSDKFEVLTVNKGIFGKILCKCPRCQLHFNEYDFLNHIAVKCDTQTAKTCDVCKLKIPEKLYQKHTINHRKYNYTLNDYIIVEYVDAVNDVGKMEPGKKPVLYYCEICKTYLYQRRKQLSHDIGKCKKLPRKLAASGLLVPQKTPKNTKKHIMNHEHQNLTLHDYMFFRLSDGAAIDPPMPDFFQCSDCAVRFSSKYDLRFHNCKTVIPKTCKKCPEKFDATAYNLHLKFHDYYESKANLEGENSVPKIIFSCASCGYGFDVYDYLVRHCQNHFINSHVAPTKSCKTCNLRYPNAHEIHDRHFRILNFKHDTLLSDCWWDGFNAVSKKTKDDILANSAYGRIRNIRLDVIMSGPSERILYKCAQCNLYFNIDSVVSHTTEGCSETSRLQCESCDAVFADSNVLEQHLNIHVLYGDDIEFLKVAFNDMKDKDLNNALRESPKESLKFRKCSFCGLLIKKDDYQQHMKDHDCRQAETHVSKVGVEYKLYPEKHGTQKRIYTIYKCIKCMQTIMHRCNIPRHNCNYYKGAKCGKCSQWVRSKFTKYHNDLHSKLPKFLTKNIKVLEFEILDKTKAEKTKDQAYKELGNPDPDFDDNEIEGNETFVARKNRGYNENYVEGEDSEDSNIVRNTVGNFGDVDAEGQTVQDVVTLVNKKIVKYKLYHPKNDTHKRLYSIYKCKNCSQVIMCKINVGRHKCNWHSGTKCGKCSQWIRLYSLNKHKKLHAELPKFLTKNINVIEFVIQDNQAKTFNKTLNELEKPVLKEPQAASVRPNESVKDKKDDEVDKENETSKGPYVFRKSRVYIEEDTKSDGSEDTAEKIVENIEEIDETLALPNLNNILDRKIYQCSRCYMCFINRNVLIGHQLKCIDTVVNTLICSLCDFTYHTCHSVFHEQLHESMKFPKIYLTHTSTKGIRVSDKLNWLYKCDTCNGHYLSWRSLQRHLDIGQHDASEFISCDVCNLRFTLKSRTKHMKIHHKDNFNWCLESLNFETAVSKIIYKDTSSVNTPDIEDVRDISNDENTTLISENRTPSDKNIKFMPRVEGVDNNLYRCMVCCVNFVNRSTLNSHVKTNTHRVEGYKCHVCGLMFSSATLAKHTYVHHEIMKLKREDFHITTITGKVVLDDNIDNADRAININDTIENSTSSDGAFNNSVKTSGTGGEIDEISTEITSVDTDIVPLIRLKNKLIRRVKSDRKVEDQKITLYQCKDCKVCVRKTQTKFHVCCSDIRRKQCIQCSLVFERTDFIQHLRLHKRLQLSRKNFTLVKFGHFSNRNRVYKCVICSTHFVGLAALEWHIGRAKHDCTTVTCDVCQLNFGKSSISRHLIVHHTRLSESQKQFDIFSVRCINNDLSKHEEEACETNNSSNVSESAAILALESTIKLFRCVECDVFFLTQGSYYQHIYNHAALDPTEFIECKMCQLPFLTESLADHMKTHKNKTFNLEQVLIESFEPTTGQFVTKRYEAEDMVSSKHIVSTTTPFDEVGTVKIEEQQSTIDSTSDVNS